jgi:hypothetical protein
LSRPSAYPTPTDSSRLQKLTPGATHGVGAFCARAAVADRSTSARANAGASKIRDILISVSLS